MPDGTFPYIVLIESPVFRDNIPLKEPFVYRGLFIFAFFIRNKIFQISIA